MDDIGKKMTVLEGIMAETKQQKIFKASQNNYSGVGVDLPHII